jgi:hypothetical protein
MEEHIMVRGPARLDGGKCGKEIAPSTCSTATVVCRLPGCTDSNPANATTFDCTVDAAVASVVLLLKLLLLLLHECHGRKGTIGTTNSPW